MMTLNVGLVAVRSPKGPAPIQCSRRSAILAPVAFAPELRRRGCPGELVGGLWRKSAIPSRVCKGDPEDFPKLSASFWQCLGVV